MLLRLGTIRFGPPDEATIARINALDDVDRQDDLWDRFQLVNSWQELFEGT